MKRQPGEIQKVFFKRPVSKIFLRLFIANGFLWYDDSTAVIKILKSPMDVNFCPKRFHTPRRSSLREEATKNFWDFTTSPIANDEGNTEAENDCDDYTDF